MAKKSRAELKQKKSSGRLHTKDYSRQLSHAVLSAFFPTLTTLRVHLIAKVSSLERSPARRYALKRLQSPESLGNQPLATLLDTALVGLTQDTPAVRSALNIGDAEASIAASKSNSDELSQGEVVDIALQILFERTHDPRPLNIITQGYRRDTFGKFEKGVYNTFPNSHVNTLKSPLWQRLLHLVREEVMLDLLLNASIFIPVKNECYYQLIGLPISELTPLAGNSVAKRPAPELPKIPNAKRKKVENDIHLPSRITFVRSRMFYSRPAFNAHGDVTFGLRHIHVLNQYPDPHSKEHTLHILQYIFPRQFGLHNVFTSTVDASQTSHRFKDYTLREEEIRQAKARNDGKSLPVPKRLRGPMIDLVSKLQALHKKCSYNSLVRYYCPVHLCDKNIPDQQFILPSSIPEPCATAPMVTQLYMQSRVHEHQEISKGNLEEYIDTIENVPRQSPKQSFIDHASSADQVSAFVRSVVGNVIPKAFLGGEENEKVIMKNIDRFIRLRRFELLSLHEIMQNLKVKDFTWLVPQGMDANTSLSQSDKCKRIELLSEFMYWLFDSFTIPLISAHFYVTESGAHQYKIFYFRHDLWRKLSEPSLSKLKLSMFEELKTDRAKKILASRKLGYAQVRLLPKETGVRPIMNLKRRSILKSTTNGKETSFGRSINTVMRPVFNVMKYEKNRNPECVGSSMFHTREMYHRIKAFKSKIQKHGWQNRKLYFVKLDIQACFDTIPQKKLIRIAKNLITEDEYRMEKYAELTASDVRLYDGAATAKSSVSAAKVRPKIVWHARSPDDLERFEDFSNRSAESGKKHVVFVDRGVQFYKTRDELLDLLEEHVLQNIVKIGKKFYRQTNGIPQGSVLSTILCNVFYGDLERQNLSFVTDDDGILLRQTDDFLFITLNRNSATQFIKIMYNGLPEYGAMIGHDKTLVNFETSINGSKINRLVGTLEFPYCGSTIHTKTLNIRSDMERKMDMNVRNSVTMVHSKNAGQALYRQIVTTFKRGSDTMFLDAELNSTSTVLTNLYRNFMDVAMKFYRHSKSLPRRKGPNEKFLIKTVSEVLEFAFVMMKSRQKCAGNVYTTLNENQVKWLGAAAFRKILGRKQARYRGLLQWLDKTCEKYPAGGVCKRIAKEESEAMASRQY